jgi:hypothetical protein
MLSSTNWWGGKMGLIYNRYDFLSEGDSLDWMRLIPTGLRSLEDASYGGWGGRYEFKGVKDHENISWYASADSNSLSPWIEAIQDDFAARASWCTARTYEEANHAPSLSIEEGTDLTAKAGEEILLHPLAEDPDGDAVTLLAYQYAPADSYPDQIDENGDETATIAPKLEGDVISFKIPEDAKAGETIHLIVEAVDQASLPMHHYARVIISIS